MPPTGRAARPFAAVVPWGRCAMAAFWAGMREIGRAGIGKIKGKGGGL